MQYLRGDLEDRVRRVGLAQHIGRASHSPSPLEVTVFKHILVLGICRRRVG